RIGDQITRETRFIYSKETTGPSGPLVFVVVRHEISNGNGLAVAEEHDIVYRDHGSAGASQAAPADAAWERTIQADDVLLFRYSALTFNAHRIHYDRRYATEVEGYPGLVVHGPLIATLLMDLLRRELPDAFVAAYQFKAIRPLFDLNHFFVCGERRDEKTV